MLATVAEVMMQDRRWYAVRTGAFPAPPPSPGGMCSAPTVALHARVAGLPLCSLFCCSAHRAALTWRRLDYAFRGSFVSVFVSVVDDCARHGKCERKSFQGAIVHGLDAGYVPRPFTNEEPQRRMRPLSRMTRGPLHNNGHVC